MSTATIQNQKLKFEDELDEEAILMEVSGSAAINAVKESQALGLTIHVIRDNKIIAIHPDNSTEVIKELPEKTQINKNFKKGTVLRRK
jgi:hypothetical protein